MPTRYVDDLSQLKSTESKVRYLFDKYPELRDKPYNYIISKFWSVYNNIDVSPDYIAKLTPMEDISRSTRKVIAKNPEKYSPTKASLIIRRGQRFIAHQENAVEGKLNYY